LKNKLVFGISQYPDKKVYILIFNNFTDYCIKCNNEYEDNNKWCKQCQINQLKNNFKNWTSGNEKINELIQKMQLKINKYSDVVIEWIPDDELIEIKEINGIDGFATAIWKNGPLCYSSRLCRRYKRKLNENVLLRYLSNDTFLKEV
jgi:hypothetical protein